MGGTNKKIGLEIPVVDFQRAKNFYTIVWNYDIEEEEIDGKLVGFFPYDSSIGVRCAIVREDKVFHGRTKKDPVYLDCPRDISVITERVLKAGGRVIEPKTLISRSLGYYATFEDLDGNYIYLHSLKRTTSL
jgi:predicted enzyme related to lactoylglutathione lyase